MRKSTAARHRREVVHRSTIHTERNVDGAVRKVAGPGLHDACLALPEIKPVIHENEEPRDISRWAETAKKRGLTGA